MSASIDWVMVTTVPISISRFTTSAPRTAMRLASSCTVIASGTTTSRTTGLSSSARSACWARRFSRSRWRRSEARLRPRSSPTVPSRASERRDLAAAPAGLLVTPRGTRRPALLAAPARACVRGSSSAGVAVPGPGPGRARLGGSRRLGRRRLLGLGQAARRHPLSARLRASSSALRRASSSFLAPLGLGVLRGEALLLHGAAAGFLLGPRPLLALLPHRVLDGACTGGLFVAGQRAQDDAGARRRRGLVNVVLGQRRRLGDRLRRRRLGRGLRPGRRRRGLGGGRPRFSVRFLRTSTATARLRAVGEALPHLAGVDGLLLSSSRPPGFFSESRLP